MPSAVRGVHAFHPSQQIFGTIVNVPFNGPDNNPPQMLPPPIVSTAMPSCFDSGDEDPILPPSKPAIHLLQFLRHLLPQSASTQHLMTVLQALSGLAVWAHMANDNATLHPVVH